MASKDSIIKLYDNSVQLEYRDKSHRYFVTDILSENEGKAIPVRGVTTIMDAVLEKKGLMTWPLGLALRELFGFYDFKNEKGAQLTGFSKGVGTMWADQGKMVHNFGRDQVLPHILSASKAWQRTKKTGADIGSIVHEAIEMFVTGKPFTIDLATYKSSQQFASELEEHEWDKTAPGEVEKAKTALDAFIVWWKLVKPELIASEQLIYSRDLKYAGSYDALLKLGGKVMLADWKTSNASASKEAAAPEGVYYSYFIQMGGYARAHYEMTGQMVDDLLCVSARKDGQFSLVTAGDLGLSVQDCMDWWEAVLICYKFATRTKTELLNRVKED